MYRSKDESKKFSFSRLINNAVPNAAPAPIPTTLSPAALAAVRTHQQAQPNPALLSDQAFLHARITSSPKTSAAIYKALVKNGVTRSDGRVDTRGISRNFAHEVAVVTSHAKKKIVNLLFWWEGEGQGEGQRQGEGEGEGHGKATSSVGTGAGEADL
ncbi:hypothetical protein ACEQ8H_006976 [Pleosporales sp. CAS-2024a]